MERVHMNGTMDNFSKEIGKMVKKMVLEYGNHQMEIAM